jgi:hypothetical protein
MATPTTTISLDALQVVGGLLPSSLLQTVGELKAKQQDPWDYEPALKKGGLRDRIDQAWVDLKALWAEYQRLRLHADHDVAGLHVARRLLKEVFGWPDVEPVNGWQQGEFSYPITHRAFGGAVPLVLKGIDSDRLDKGDPRFGQDGRKRSPHSCLQDCLNADDGANWGLLCNGESLRLLHDNPSLVKPAYLAADLQQLVEGEKFDEFAVLWLTLHASRFRHPKSGECVLDQWKQEAEDTGERALGQLRAGVENALVQLGNGLLAHPSNQELRKALEQGSLSKQAFHGELLRLIYRFLFLLTAEDRELLYPPALEGSDPRRQIYREGYSVGRLRDLALLRSAYEGDFEDLWQVQRLVFSQLSRDGSPLGLPGLGGLFDAQQCPHLDPCELSNRYLLRAIHTISWFRSKENSTLSRVNYRDLNTEELGSVYEGLLELHPEIKPIGGGLELSYGGGGGSDRKTSGSYYTPDVLVQELIKSALMPVIRDRLGKASTRPEKEQALLDLRVLDPACGSGHFLLAAARRIALELAKVRAGDDQPSEADRQHAMREAVAHCLYGVDKNPMAVELCKVALWIEAIDPGKPLSFLDTHIQCGDSLVGVFDPEVLKDGIPDGAYKQLTGDEKPVCTSLKKANQQFIKRGQRDLFSFAAGSNAVPSQAELDAVAEDNLAGVAAKAQAHRAWLQQPAVQQQLLAANAYTAAFFMSKTTCSQVEVPTSEHLDAVLQGGSIPAAMAAAVTRAADDFRFLQWHLAFPDVMQAGGFDCLLGNPPWERIKLQEKEFFAARSEAIATAPNKVARERLIQALNAADASEADRALVYEFELAKREAEGSGEFIRSSGRFALTAVGDLNTYALFAEHFLNLIGPDGRAGLIVPTGIATDNSTKAFFDGVSSGGRLVSLYDFENRDAIFPGVHRSYKFAVLTLGEKVERTDFVFFATAVNQLADQRRHFTLSPDDVALINPNTRTCPIFRSQMDAELTKEIYKRVPVLIEDREDEQQNLWGARFVRMFDMTNDSHLFLERPGTNHVPLYEAKMTSFYNHRSASYASRGGERGYRVLPESTIEELQNPDYSAEPFYWVAKDEANKRLRDKGWEKDWLIGFSDITSATNERTFVCTLLPRVAAGNKLPFLLLGVAASKPVIATVLLANLSSLPFDFIVRQKVGGVTLNFFLVKQFPVLPPSAYDSAAISFIHPRVLELTYTSHDLQPWAQDLGYDGPPFCFDPERRVLLRAELDAYYARLYGLTRDELRYILDPADLMGPDYPSETFRVLKNNEIRQFGEYRTQRMVLEAWDRLFDS